MAQDYAPIEIVLDVRRFQDERVRQPGSSRKEFFVDDDQGFVAHKSRIQKALVAVGQRLRASSSGPVGLLRVRLREDALAKSHRPIKSLFQPTFTPAVGSSGVGEMIIQVTPSTIERALAETQKAEDHGRFRPHKSKPEVQVPDPSQPRAEVGAIESLGLWEPADRRGFDANRAVNWFAEHSVPRAYRIDLFDLIRPSQKQAGVEFDKAGDMLADLLAQLDADLDCGYVVATFRPDARSMSRMYIWLLADPSVRHVVSPGHVRRLLENVAETTLDVRHHAQVLLTLEQHPIVRRISLPAHLKAGAATSVQPVAGAVKHQISTPQSDAQYPVVGVIDGGMDAVIGDWVVHGSNFVHPLHSDLTHGTEIGALLVEGQALNSSAVCPEPDGCWLADLALIPEVDHYVDYFQSDLDLVGQIEFAVQEAKGAANARVFSFSHNFEEPPGGNPTYTDLSQGLDRIARENDVIFVVSGGNTASPRTRREWGDNPVAVLSNLASCTNDRITAPADSILNVTVGAVNPPDVPGSIAGAPARYSRRGPGFMQLVKPDVAHYGGVCESTSANSGLRSVTEKGLIKKIHGTSYSAPLAAKALARYDQLTQSALPREALIALLIHGARIPDCLQGFNRSEIVRNLVGFGVPVNAQEMINGAAHAATLLFHDRMMPKKDLFFGFDWPKSLVQEGKCRGKATLTLVYSPPVSDAFESELVRVNLEASLQRRDPKTGKFTKKCKDTFSDGGATGAGASERELMEDGLKWGVVKQSCFISKRGSGLTSDWRVALKYLVRSDEVFPDEGVPFCMLLTIEDIDGVEPVYQDMKIGLSARQVLTADVRQPSGRIHARGGRSSG